jgi:hypothetical protein
MTKKEIIEDLKNVPDDAQVVIAKCLVIDEKEEITAEIHIPIIGVAYSPKVEKNEAELRFVLSLDDVKQCFHPKDVRFFPPEAITEREIG